MLAFPKPYKNHCRAASAAGRNPAGATGTSDQGTERDADDNDNDPAVHNVGKQANQFLQWSQAIGYHVSPATTR